MSARARLAIALAGAAAAVVPFPAPLVERLFSQGVYPLWQPGVTAVTNLVPFALLDLALLGLVAAIAWRMKALRARTRPLWPRVRDVLLDLAALGGALALAFLAVWGLHYQREPLVARLAHDTTRVTPVAVRALAWQAADRLNALHAAAHAASWPAPAVVSPSLRRGFRTALAALGDRDPVTVGRPKATWLGWYFRRAAIDGMTDPFFLEILLNPDLLPVERPFVVAHEWAHLAGRAHEAEASFVGWLACVHGDVQSAYSAWLFLYVQAAGALPREEAAAVGAALEAGPQADLAAVAARLALASPQVRDVAWRTYDRYLKANRIPEGVTSYAAVLDLVVGTEFAPGWMPRRR